MSADDGCVVLGTELCPTVMFGDGGFRGVGDMGRRNVLRRIGRAAVAAGAGEAVVEGVDQKSVSAPCGEEENSYWA